MKKAQEEGAFLLPLGLRWVGQMGEWLFFADPRVWQSRHVVILYIKIEAKTFGAIVARLCLFQGKFSRAKLIFVTMGGERLGSS